MAAVTSVPRCLPSIAERFGDVDAPDLLGPCEVSDGTRDFEDAVISARRQAHRGGCIGKQALARLVGRGDGIKLISTLHTGTSATAPDKSDQSNTETPRRSLARIVN